MGVCTNRWNRSKLRLLLCVFALFTLPQVSLGSITEKDVVDKTKESSETTLDLKDFENAPATDFDLKRIGIKVPDDPTMGSKAEGDILMPKQKEKKFLDERTGLGRNAIRQSYRKWPNNEIPYTLSTQYGSYSRSVIAKAMNEYHTKTCVKFVPRDTKKHRDYVYIHPDDGCYSLVGRVGGRQPLSLDSGCIQTGTIVHELMHTVGFFHEQSRYDRDHYIEIVWPNVINGADDQFEKYGTNVIDQFNEPYDYSSIMHYGPYAFSANGKRTILPRRSGSQKMGQRIQFSDVDLRKINRLYQCDSQTMIKKPPRPQLPIQEVGHFIIQPNGRGLSIHGWNSNQGGEFGTTATVTTILTTTTETPTTFSTTTTTTETPTSTEASKPISSVEEDQERPNEPTRDCVDRNWRCAFWSMSVFGYCDKYAEVRDQICPFSCRACTPHRSAQSPDCVDKSSACSRIHEASCESPLTQLLCPRVCGACADAEFATEFRIDSGHQKPSFFPPPILAQSPPPLGGGGLSGGGEPFIFPSQINSEPGGGGGGEERTASPVQPGIRGVEPEVRLGHVEVGRPASPAAQETLTASQTNGQQSEDPATPTDTQSIQLQPIRPTNKQIDLGTALAASKSLRPQPAAETHFPQPPQTKLEHNVDQQSTHTAHTASSGATTPDVRCFDVSDPQTCAVVRQVQLCALRLDCARTCGLC